MRIAGVIIAGGRSSRMGREKAMIELAGKPLIQWVIDRLSPQLGLLAVNANGDAGRYAGFGLPVIPDAVDAGTPLSGVHAVLSWAKASGLEAVLTVPSDSPFLPGDLVMRLRGEGPAVAASGGQRHFLTGVWPTGLLPHLEASLPQIRYPFESDAGTRAKSEVIRVQDWASRCGARVAEWPRLPYDPFFNVNTPDELVEANRIAAEFFS
jgi:molybdopterin-guanine dinucleotide biosynthesis protein A